MDIYTISILSGVFVFVLLTFQPLSRKGKAANWESYIKGDAETAVKNEVIDKEFGSFYGKINNKMGGRFKEFENILGVLGASKEQTQMELERANMQNVNAEDFLVSRVFLGIIGVASGIGFAVIFRNPNGILIGAFAGVGLYFYPAMKVKQTIAQREKEIEKTLPDFLDLLIILLEIGIPINEAVDEVATAFPNVTGEEFKRAVLESKFYSGSLAISLKKMATRNGVENLSDLVTSMIVAIEKGTPLAPILREQVARIRYVQQQEFEEEAGKLATKILPVTLLFIVMPLMVLLMAPAFVNFF